VLVNLNLFHFQNMCNFSPFKIVDVVGPIHRNEMQLCLSYLEVDFFKVIN